MSENSNQLTGLLSQLESFLTEKHGASGSNLMEKVNSLKGVVSGDLHDKITGVLGQLGGEGGLGSMLSGFFGGGKSDADAPAGNDGATAEHVDSVKGILGELHSLFGGNDANETGDSSEKSGQTDERRPNNQSDDGSGLGDLIGGVLKSITGK